MIIIKQHQQKWRIILGDEVWEFQTKKEFEESLKKLIDMKSKYGNLKNYLSKL